MGEKVDPLGIALIVVQIAKAYQLFANATKDMSPEEQAELWARTVNRAKQAREIWEQS